MCNSLEGSIEGLVFGADLIRFKGVNVKRQKIKTKKINLIAYEWRFCGVIWNVSKEKRAGSKIILCLYSLVKILHSLYGSTQLASSMRTNIMKCFVSSSADDFFYLKPEFNKFIWDWDDCWLFETCRWCQFGCKFSYQNLVITRNEKKSKSNFSSQTPSIASQHLSATEICNFYQTWKIHIFVIPLSLKMHTFSLIWNTWPRSTITFFL